jgi:ABC-2 type transport system ATP-binding protein
MSSAFSILRVRGLSKTYGAGLFSRKGFRALDDVTLEVGRGTVFGLLGPNGAGKTTLVKILLGLVRGYEGEAALFDLPPRDPRSRRRVGYLPEAHRLPGYLTGRQVMRLFARMSGCEPRAAEARIDPLLERVGMLQSAERKVREYSKGMQQRLGLAQALVNEPDLVFLDEPTDGVDPVGRAAIRELVLELKRRGVTLFINSHLLMEVEMICDRVVIMSKGKIISEGSVDELTPRTGAVRFDVRELPENLDRVLAGVGGALRADGTSFEIHLNDGEIDAVVDRLRAAAVGIRAIAPRRLTLEESFIDLLRKEKR